MKTRLFILLFALVTLHVWGQDKDDDNIKKAVSAETDAYYNHDAEAWQAAWMHDAGVNRTYVANGSYNTSKGWQNFGPQMVTWLKANPKQAFQVKSDSFLIKSDGKMAWIDYKQYSKTSTPDTGYQWTTRERRVLIKDKGAWKIFSMISEEPESFTSVTPQSIENSMNATGYNLLNIKKINDAIEVFKLNVKLFPDSWNTYDSLGEALALAGDKEGAIANYEKSMVLNPKNDNGKAILEKLKSK